MTADNLSQALANLDAAGLHTAEIVTTMVQESGHAPGRINRSNFLINAAYARMAEARAFMEMAVDTKLPADPRLERLDLVLRESVDMVGQIIQRAGVDIPNGIDLDQLDDFLVKQERSVEAINQARVAAAAVVLHLDRALSLTAAPK